MSSQIIKKFQNLLLKWIKEKDEEGRPNYRDYPWRKSKDPCKILITEILLQKTNSAKVADLYPQFYKNYPSVKHIYNSKKEDLIKVLEPLGLQNEKAERLLIIAKKILYDFGEILPSDKESLLELKGVGEYIAGAVLCFGFNKKCEIVDTNVVRIYQRVFEIISDKTRPRTDKKIWEFAKRVLPEKNFRSFNFALLDFGAKICKSRRPLCSKCFFPEDCIHYKRNKPNYLKSKIEEKKIKN